jgi:hypothetical protein
MVLEILNVSLAIASVVAAVASWITSIRASAKTAKKHLVVEWSGYAQILKSAEKSMNSELTRKQKEVITKIVWRSASVSLIQTLKIPQERNYIFRALANPDEYPWETEKSGVWGADQSDIP